MKISHRNETTRAQNSKSCLVYEYPTGASSINGAFVELRGREPDEGCVVNTECTELAYIIRGVGMISIDGKEIELTAGDLVLIEPGEKFFWNGDMDLFIPCSPAWNPDQYKKVN